MSIVPALFRFRLPERPRVSPQTNHRDEGKRYEPPISRRWWESNGAVALYLALAALPLLWPTIPPLTDLPGHLGQFAIETAPAGSPLRERFFGFVWRPIGNLGFDLLILPLSAILPLEFAVKLLTLLLPVLTTGAVIALARELHGRVPATTLFALPLCYGYAFQFGFVNFVLSMALALYAYAWWLRLGRLGRFGWRSAAFGPVAAIIWTAHVYGWLVLGLLAFAAELAWPGRQERWPILFGRTIVRLLPMSLPLIPTVVWRSTSGGELFSKWFALREKALWLMAILIDRWRIFDLIAAVICFGILGLALLKIRQRFEPRLGLGAALLGCVFLIMPGTVFGSYFADMRLTSYAVLLGLVAIRPAAFGGRSAGWWALAGLAFLLVRTAGTAASFALFDADYAAQFKALDHLPREATVLVQVQDKCGSGMRRFWSSRRIAHLGDIAIVRRHAFVNTQWGYNDGNLVRIRYNAGAPYVSDPSELLLSRACPAKDPGAAPEDTALARTLRTFPRAAFDYVWLIGIEPSRARRLPDLQPVWSDPAVGALYRVAQRPPSVAIRR